MMKAAGDLAGSIGELIADGAIDNGDAVIDDGRGRPRWLLAPQAGSRHKGRASGDCGSYRFGWSLHATRKQRRGLSVVGEGVRRSPSLFDLVTACESCL